MQPKNYFCIFYPFELKLCIPKNRMFFIFDFNGFWRENDVTRLTAKFKFQVMASLLRRGSFSGGRRKTRKNFSPLPNSQPVRKK